MTQPSGTLGLSHLLIAADAELALLNEARLYLGNRKLLPEDSLIALESAHRASPTNGTHLPFPLVFSLLHGCGVILIRGISSFAHNVLTYQVIETR